MNTNEKNVNEKNINEEVLEEVSGGWPVGNYKYHDENGDEKTAPPSPNTVTPDIHF